MGYHAIAVLTAGERGFITLLSSPSVAARVSRIGGTMKRSTKGALVRAPHHVTRSFLRVALVLVVVGASIGAVSPVAAAPPTQSSSLAEPNPWLDRRVLNMAHQGGEIEAPSDTMFAFKTALDKGADVLEMDVHATADGEIVVLHDATVDRTTNGTGRVDQLTLEQIRQLTPPIGTRQAAGPVTAGLMGSTSTAASQPGNDRSLASSTV